MKKGTPSRWQRAPRWEPSIRTQRGRSPAEPQAQAIPWNLRIDVVEVRKEFRQVSERRLMQPLLLAVGPRLEAVSQVCDKQRAKKDSPAVGF